MSLDNNTDNLVSEEKVVIQINLDEKDIIKRKEYENENLGDNFEEILRTLEDKLESTERDQKNHRKNNKSDTLLGADITQGLPLEGLKKFDFQNVTQSSAKRDVNLSELEKKKESKIKKPISYEIFKLLMGKYDFKCWNGQIYVYLGGEGRYKNLVENKLKTLIRSRWSEEIQEKISRNVMLEIVERLLTEPSIQVDEDYFNCYSYLMNFLNGVLDLRTDEFMEHSPEYRFTNCIQAKYNPFNKGGHTFKRFIKTCMGDNQGKEKHLQEVLGYMLSEFYTAKKVPILIGEPHSGKSTLGRIVSTLIGKEHVASVPLHKLRERFIPAHLSTKKVNICSEIGDEVLSNIEIFKAITGNDELVAEFKGKDHFTYKSKIKLMFSGNLMPILKNRDITSAFFDRLTFINFNYTVPEKDRDHNLEDKLLSEDKEYIIAWAVKGVRRLMNNNFVFSESEESVQYKKRYIIEQNNTIDFVKSKCIIAKGEKAHLKELYSAYIRYCSENCFNAYSKDDFFSEISKYEVKKKKFRLDGSNPLWGYEGITLRDEKE